MPQLYNRSCALDYCPISGCALEMNHVRVESHRGGGPGFWRDVDPDEISAGEPDDDEGIEQVEAKGRGNE